MQRNRQDDHAGAGMPGGPGYRGHQLPRGPDRRSDLEAVIEHPQLSSVVLAAHDASGPPAISWALDHPRRVAAPFPLPDAHHDLPMDEPAELSGLLRALPTKPGGVR